MPGHWLHGSRRLCVVGTFDPTLSVCAGISNVLLLVHREWHPVTFRASAWVSTPCSIGCAWTLAKPTLFVLFHFLLVTRVSLTGLVRQALRFVSVLLCVFVRVRIRALRRGSSHSSSAPVPLHRVHYDCSMLLNMSITRSAFHPQNITIGRRVVRCTL